MDQTRIAFCKAHLIQPMKHVELASCVVQQVFGVESNCSHATSTCAHATLMVVRGAPALRRTRLRTFAGTTGASQADEDAFANAFAAADVTVA